MTPLIAYVLGAASGMSMPYIYRLIVGRRQTKNGQAWGHFKAYIQEQHDQSKAERPLHVKRPGSGEPGQ